ncbi:hypothetical protein JCM10450v2_003570 [Rhodotorula kratochvilovae]
MGRRKISIAPIKDDRNRQVTFLKRKNGLFKKAYELGVLCSADVAVVVFNANGKLFEFHSGDMDSILLRYSHYSGPAHEKRGPEDYINKDLDAATKSGTGGKMTTLSDEDGSDDDDDKPRVAAGSSGVRAIPQNSKGKQALRAQAERKAKGLEPARSQSEEGRTPSDSRASSFSGPPPAHYEQPHHPEAGALPQPPTDPSQLQQQQNGFVPPGALPFPLAGMPNLAGAPGPGGMPNLAGQMGNLAAFNPFAPGGAGGLPGFPGFPPNFSFPLPGAFGFPGAMPPQPSPQQPNGAPGQNGGGVPAWFGTMNPQGGGQMPQAPHLQLLQQLGGLPAAMQGWPGMSMPDPNAALQALQQQQQQQHDAIQHQHQQPQFQSPFAQPHHLMHQQPQPHGSPSAHSHPIPAPMYGTPATMPPPPPTAQHGTPPVYPPAHGEDHASSRPGSVSSMHSHAQSHPSPHAHGSPHAHAQGAPPGRSDSWLNKPRLSVAIPAEGGAKEGTQPGLVTAGGASILGAGLMTQEPKAEEGEGQPAQPPKSAFAADLLPSPFYPNAGGGSTGAFAFPFSGGASAAPQPPAFQWPGSSAPPPQAQPAPMLGAEEAPDLLRRGSFAELTSAAAAAQGGEGDDSARGTKRVGGDEGEEEGEGGAGGRRKRRG